MAQTSTPAGREALHALVEALPDDTLDEASRYLRGLATDDPVLKAALLAPAEDEPISAQEEALVAEARATRARGEGVADEDLDRALGW